jgi:hypothetical protein
MMVISLSPSFLPHPANTGAAWLKHGSGPGVDQGTPPRIRDRGAGGFEPALPHRQPIR